MASASTAATSHSIDRILQLMAQAGARKAHCGATIGELEHAMAKASCVDKASVPTHMIHSAICGAGLGGTVLAGTGESVPGEALQLAWEGTESTKTPGNLEVKVCWEKNAALRKADRAKPDTFGNHSSHLNTFKARHADTAGVVKYMTNARAFCTTPEGLLAVDAKSKVRSSLGFQIVMDTFPHLPSREDMEGFRRCTLAYPIGYGDAVLQGPQDPCFRVSKAEAHSSARGRECSIDWGKLSGYALCAAKVAARVADSKGVVKRSWVFRISLKATHLNYATTIFEPFDVTHLINPKKLRDAAAEVTRRLWQKVLARSTPSPSTRYSVRPPGRPRSLSPPPQVRWSHRLAMQSGKLSE